ncbi:hypothetical protein H9647_01675 [Paenibacillus sp. Sa2BVA9]|uniref:Small peptidoglycan-associated lipoprotein n=2 Tax=Paenibacillus gallinarum TaxID=2762232 RepID=A0ABR8STG5_9BACL|nr:hypothetical protein [Paenibacillus gallinarum]
MNLFSKRSFFILTVITCIFLISGCGGPSRQDVMKYLEPSGEGEYAVHFFYEDSLPMTETNELNIFHNSHPIFLDTINKIQFWNQDIEPYEKWAKVLGIKDFPVYLVMDAEGIVLETPYLSRVKEFLKEELLPKDTNSNQ